MPVHRYNLDSLLTQDIANRAIIAQKYHGKSVTTGIQKLCKVDHGQRNAVRRLLTGSEYVDCVRAAQDRTAVLIL
jgi:hypothetical protein